MKILAHIVGGHMDDKAKTALMRYFAKVKNGDVIITAKLPEKPSSWEQHKYCHGVVIPIIAQCMGHQKHEYHEVYQYVKYAVWAKYYPGQLPPSFSKEEANTVEFEDFMSKTRQWASEFLGCYVPEPNAPECELFYN